MRKQGVLVIIAISAVVTLSFGQKVSEVSYLDATVNPGVVLDEFPPPPPSMEGSYFMDEEWANATLELNSNRSIRNVPVRYDLVNEQLEIKTSYGIRVCNLQLLRAFQITEQHDSSYYYNTQSLNWGSKIPSGIAKVVLSRDDFKVLEFFYTEIREPTYVPALDMGSKNKKILKKSDLYLLQKGKALKVNKKIKRNQHIFREHLRSVEEFTRSNNYRLSEFEGAFEIFSYYHSLIEKKPN